MAKTLRGHTVTSALLRGWAASNEHDQHVDGSDSPDSSVVIEQRRRIDEWG